MKIEIEESFYSVKVMFNSHLHVCVRKPVIALQAWVEGYTLHTIQLTTPHGEITCEYESREVFDEVLRLWNSVLK